MRTLKNILNTIFLFGAIIGMYLYYKGNDAGTIVIMVAMGFKFVEVALRLFKKDKDKDLQF